MTRLPRRNHSATFKTKVALEKNYAQKLEWSSRGQQVYGSFISNIGTAS